MPDTQHSHTSRTPFTCQLHVPPTTYLPHAIRSCCSSHPCTGCMPFLCHPHLPCTSHTHPHACHPVCSASPPKENQAPAGDPKEIRKAKSQPDRPRPSPSQEGCSLLLPARCSPLQVQPSRVMTCRQMPQGFTFLKVFTLKWWLLGASRSSGCGRKAQWSGLVGG